LYIVDKESNYDLMINRISDGILSLDKSYKVTYVNAYFKKMFNIMNSSIIGESISAIFPQELVNAIHETLEKQTSNINEFTHELYINGDYSRWVKCYIYLSLDGATIITRDITAKKQVEENIKEKHEKLVLLAEAANHLIFKNEPKEILDSLFDELSDYLDLDVYFNYIIDYQENKLRLLNYQGIPEKIAKEIEWLDYGEAVCGCVARDRERIMAENINISEDPRVQLVKGFGIKAYVCHPLLSYGKLIGTLSFGSSKRSSFSNEELDLVFTICNQVAITLERYFLISELKRKRQEAEKANKAKSDFLLMVSHELRTPLNSILGYAQILEDNNQETLSEYQVDKVKKILRSSRHLLSVINEILDLIKVEEQTIQLSLQQVKINTMIQECLQTVQTELSKKNITVKLDLDPRDFQVHMNREKMNQVIINLLINAIKYSLEGGEITISLGLVNEHDIKLSVVDHGIGIPTEEQQRIFAPFYRVPNLEYNVEGMGLGLTLVKKYIEQMKGTVQVESILNKGSKFSIILPIYQNV
jgi:PAS domain S-box-containing protein